MRQTSGALLLLAFVLGGRASAWQGPPGTDTDAPSPVPISAPPLPDSSRQETEAGRSSALPQPEAVRSEVNLAPAPLSPGDRPLPINLATALRLSDARPLVVAAAQASAMVAEARFRRAKVLWVPSLNLGVNYYRHDGGDQEQETGNLTINSRNFFLAGGGARLIVATTDAIFEPLATRQVLRARQAGIQAAKNDALLDTARAYFSVHQARGIYAGALDAQGRARELVSKIGDLGTDLVPRVEVDRARTLLQQLEQEAATARESWRVASVDLTRVLRLDPAAVVQPMEPDHLPITLIDPRVPVDDLVPVGLTNRPELASQQALVQSTLIRLKQERLRPLTPSVLITGYQTPEFYYNGGIFGTGKNSSLDQWDGRADVNLQLVWQLESFGLGNAARIRERQGEQYQATVELFTVQDRVAAEVAQAQARLESADVRIGQAEVGLRQALVTYQGNLEGLRETTRFGDVLELVNRPQEVVIALTRLKQAYDNYFTTVAEYNRAQFEMFHALGNPAQALAILNPPGHLMPVDTSRPAYMPPVVPLPIAGTPGPIHPERAKINVPSTSPPAAVAPPEPARRRFGLFHRR